MPGKIIGSLLLVSFIAAVPAAAQADCASEIARLRAVVENDAASGNLNSAVYQEMRPGLAQAAGLCQSGHGAEALRELHSLKSRYGYH